jgi:hypothetical protein
MQRTDRWTVLATAGQRTQPSLKLEQRTMTLRCTQMARIVGNVFIVGDVFEGRTD